MQTKQSRVLRPFFFQRKALKTGDMVVLPAPFAIEMEAAGKIEFIKPPVQEKAAETVEATAAKPKKEEKPEAPKKK